MEGGRLALRVRDGPHDTVMTAESLQNSTGFIRLIFFDCAGSFFSLLFILVVLLQVNIIEIIIRLIFVLLHSLLALSPTVALGRG